MPDVLASTVLLLVLLVLGVVLHALLARACKGVLGALRPLAHGEHQSFTYERFVYHTADRAVQPVVGLAIASGALAWLAWVTGRAVLWPASVVVLFSAVALDLLRWERVASSASWLWFQRGLRGTVHQVSLDNVRDVAVDEEDARELTLRNLIPGARNVVCRLRVRLADKRVIALPRTDAARGLAAVEAVANHIRQRKQHAADRDAVRRSQTDGSEAAMRARDMPSSMDAELAEELRRLRRGAARGTGT